MDMYMGIQHDGNVYGICWIIHDSQNIEIIKRYEKIESTKLNREQINEAIIEYYSLTESERNCAKIKFYTKCTSTHLVSFDNEPVTFMCWYPIDKINLERFFVSIA
jgi:hypothetical protein